MCSEEKKGFVWSTYLNYQLESLWTIAGACGDKDDLKCRYYRSLASYDYPEPAEGTSPESRRTNRITFHKPVLTFICNHAAILTVTVNEGRLSAVNDASNAQAEVPLSNIQASFRMSFTRTHVMGRDSKIDDQAADHEVRMVVFDFETATLVTTLNSTAIETFFKAYLKFLRNAGHHVLFGFPDFTDKKVLVSLPVDYAILHRAERLPLDDYCSDITYFGITLEKINTYIRETQYERAELRVREKQDLLAASITKVRWSKDSTTVYDISFDVPTVKPLCPHEVLFIFTLKEVKQSEQTQSVLENWVVAFVINVSEFDGKTLKVDFRTSRYAESFSSSLESFESTSIQRLVTTYISTEYLDILTKYNYHAIFGPPEAERRATLKDGGFWRRVHNVTDFFAVRRYGESAIWAERSQHVSLSGADHVFALSERSVEFLLHARWDQDEKVRTWGQDNFKATFKPFKIHLLSNNNVIVVVDIEEAEIVSGSTTPTVQRSRGPPLRIFNRARNTQGAADLEAKIDLAKREFYKGVLAFEVEVELQTSTNDTYVFQLKLNHTEYIEGLSDLRDRSGRDKPSDTTTAIIRRSVQQYLKELYDEKRLAFGNVLSRDSAMSFRHSVLCEKEIKVEDFLTTQLDMSDSSTMLLYGIPSDRPMPTFHWSPGWLPSADANAVGTVWISKHEFLHRLLEVLEEFNTQTTIVRHDGDNFIAFKHRTASANTQDTAQWQQEVSGELANECLEYSWNYSYDASRREGTLIRQDLDSILLQTQNRVWIPTESMSAGNEVTIALTGEHHTEASKKQKHSHQLLKKDVTVWWEVIITIASSPTGLLVTVTHEGPKEPIIEGDLEVSDPVNVKNVLKMDEIVESLRKELKETFEGTWVYSWFDLDLNTYNFTNPIFTRSGDLVFEVYRKATQVQNPVANNRPDSGRATPQPGRPANIIGANIAAGVSTSQSATTSTSTRQMTSMTTATQQTFNAGTRTTARR